MTRCFLRVGTDTIEEADACPSIEAAVEEFRETAHELARFGQGVEAFIHIARSRDDIVEYPDFVLSLGSRGGVVVRRVT